MAARIWNNPEGGAPGGHRSGEAQQPSANEGDVTTNPGNRNEPFTEPSVMDVLVVKAMLVKGIRLPLELINDIIDQAEYWPHTTSAFAASSAREAPNVIGGTKTMEDVFIIRTMPLGFVHHEYTDIHLRHDAARPWPLVQEHAPEDFQKLIGSPEPTTTHPGRRIVFEITSRDQGWGGEPEYRNTYKGSWTWFEAGLERFDADNHRSFLFPNPQEPQPDYLKAKEATATSTLPDSALRPVIPTIIPTTKPGDPEPYPTTDYHFDLAPSNHLIQSNLVSNRTLRTHRVVWSWTDNITDPASPEAEELAKAGRGKLSLDGEFVRNLKLGDVVTVWAKARFPGWTNKIERVEVKVYWAV